MYNSKPRLIPVLLLGGLLAMNSVIAKQQLLESIVGKGNPCANKGQIVRVGAEPANFLTLYNGYDKLRAAPSTLIPFPEEIASDQPKACMIFSLTIEESGAHRTAKNPRLIARSQYLNSPDDAIYTQAALRVLNAVVSSNVLPGEYVPNEIYVIAVPLWREHALYTTDFAQIMGADLAAMGYTDAKKLSENDNVTVYELFNPGLPIFVAVRSFERDEPIIHYVSKSPDTTKPGVTSNQLWEYGPATINWFSKNIAPHITTSTNYANAEVRLYAREVRFAPAESEINHRIVPYPPTTTEPRTRKSVDRVIGVIYMQGHRSSVSAPWLWEMNANKRMQPPKFNTLSQIQAQSNLVTRRNDDERAAITAARERGPQDRAPAILAVAEAVKKEEAAYITKGLAYRPSSYWASFANEKEMKNIFEGKFSDADISFVFKFIYRNYQSAFYSNCPTLIPEGAPGYDYYEVRYVRNIPMSKTPAGKIKVRPEYWQKFKQFEDNLSEDINRRSIEDMNEFLFDKNSRRKLVMSNTAFYLKTLPAINRDLSKFFKDNGCNSGLQQQFSENMRRIAYGEPVLQDAKGSFSYAALDTTRDMVKPTLLTACIDARVGRSAQYPNSWCRCLNEKFESVLTSGEMTAAINDYITFEKKISAAPIGRPNDPGWRYYQTANPCRH